MNVLISYLNVCKHELYLAIIFFFFLQICDKKNCVCKKDQRTGADLTRELQWNFPNNIFIYCLF